MGGGALGNLSPPASGGLGIMHPETCPSTFLSSFPFSLIPSSPFLLGFVLCWVLFLIFFIIIINLLDMEVTVGAGLGWAVGGP